MRLTGDSSVPGHSFASIKKRKSLFWKHLEILIFSQISFLGNILFLERKNIFQQSQKHLVFP